MKIFFQSAVAVFLAFFISACGDGDGGGGGPWTKLEGTGLTDQGNGVTVDSSGNIYITGSTMGGLDGNANAGNSDIFLIKYDSAGTKRWTRQLGTTAGDSGNGVAVDTSGSVYVTGVTFGGLDGNNNAGDSDIFLVKFNSAGTKQWTRQLGTPATDFGSGVAVDSSGNVYVTGYTNAGLDGNINAGNFDIFLAKYDSAGMKQWTRQLGTPANENACDIAVDSNGNIYITGFTLGGLDGNTNAGGSDIFLVKYNSAGTKQWTRQLGTPANDIGNGVAVDGSGSVYVTGATFGGLDGNTNAGDSDIFLVKYDLAGTKQWTRQRGTTTTDAGYDVAVDGTGNIYMTGSTLGGLDGNTNAGESDIFLIKYNSAGTREWTRQLGTPATDFGNGAAADNSGNVYITGYAGGELDGMQFIGGGDIFVLKYKFNGVKQ